MSSSASNSQLLSSCPIQRGGVVWQKLPLSPQEGFLLSRIDGRTPVSLLGHMTGLAIDAVMASLVRLVELQAIDWQAGAELRRTAQEAVATAAATPSAASDPRLDEPCDLTRDEKLELLQFEDTLAKANHWQLLGLTGDPSSSAIKRAYFSQSRRFHPDRFFGRNTGSFGARLDTIFMALKTAYAVLSNEEQRRAYAAHTPAKKDR